MLVAVALLAVSCGAPKASSRIPRPERAPSPREAASPQPAGSPGLAALGPVEPFAPVLQVTLPGGVSAEVAREIKETPGVAAAARVGLANLTAEGKEGQTGLSVAAVDPLEFRPLAPPATAHSDFVWQGLLAGRVYLAHEEQPRLGTPLGSSLPLRGPSGDVAPEVGGLAANGVPNLAGGLLSLEQARQLGIGEPTLVLVGMRPGDRVEKVRSELGRKLPEAQVNVSPALAPGTFITGPAARKAFGSFKYNVNPDGTIVPDRSWVRRNIVTRRVPILGQVTCHRLMFRQLEGALAQLEQAGLAGLIDVADYHYQGGCYVPRFIDRDPHQSLSRHAWGLAVDLNVAANPEWGPSRQDPRLVAIFERWGFRWGGRWTSPRDPMHFELAGLLKP